MKIPENPIEFRQFLTSMADQKQDSETITKEIGMLMHLYAQDGVPGPLEEKFASKLRTDIDLELRTSNVRPTETRAFQVWQKYFPNEKVF